MCKYFPISNFSGQTNNPWKHKAISENQAEERRRTWAAKFFFLHFLKQTSKQKKKQNKNHLLCACWLLEETIIYNLVFPISMTFVQKFLEGLRLVL